MIELAAAASRARPAHHRPTTIKSQGRGEIVHRMLARLFPPDRACGPERTSQLNVGGN